MGAGTQGTFGDVLGEEQSQWFRNVEGGEGGPPVALGVSKDLMGQAALDKPVGGRAFARHSEGKHGHLLAEDRTGRHGCVWGNVGESSLDGMRDARERPSWQEGQG